MRPPAALVMALAAPSLLAVSTPAGTLREQPVRKSFPSEAACLADLHEWATAERDRERAEPSKPPSEFKLEGPSTYTVGTTSYRLTRLFVSDAGGGRSTTAYIYDESCEGAVRQSVADGWVGTPMPSPSLSLGKED